MVQGPRSTMEDELCLRQDAKLGFTYAAVYDGHGGSLAAQWLAREFADIILEELDASWVPLDSSTEVLDPKDGLLRPVRREAELRRIFEDADRQLIEFLIGANGGVGTGVSGSTATVALINASKILLASLGDSMAVMSRGGAALQLTPRHRVYGTAPGVAEESARVEAAGGWLVDGRVCNVLAVSRAFGDMEFKGEGLRLLLQEGVANNLWTQEFADTHRFVSDPVICTPDVTEIEIDPQQDEFVIIATDGLWDFMPATEAVRFARQQFTRGKDAQAVAAALTDIALKRYTADNTSVIVADLKSGQWKGSQKGGFFGLFG